MKILYEDNHIIVVVKPANMPVNLDESNDTDLLSHIKDYLKEKYHKPGNVYLGLVHRLDRPVSGVMVFARTSKAASRLSDSLRKGQFSKQYLAVCLHKAEESQKLTDYLIKDSATNTTSVTDSQHGKLAVLNYSLIDYKNDLSLVKVQLQTGRSHQIRVQMSSHGLPLWGDQRYNRHAVKGQQIALFASRLSFPHPVSREMMTITALPDNTEPWNIFNLERLNIYE